MNGNAQSGFTLVELIVAIAIFILLSLAAGVLYVMVVRQQIDDRLVQDLQREADRVTAQVERNVSDATGVGSASTCNVENADRITLDTPDGALTYQRNGGQIEFSQGSTTEGILSSGVTATDVSFFPTCDGGALVALRFKATLSKTAVGQSETTDISTSIGTRPQ